MSDYQTSIEVDVYLNDLTYQIARSVPQHKAMEFVLLLDAEYADKGFTVALVKGLVEVLNDEYDMSLALVDDNDKEDA